MQFKPLPNAEYAWSRLHYDSVSGDFRRKPTFDETGRCTNPAFAGELAGGVNPSNGTLYIYIDGKLYAAHRLAWLMMTGKEPEDQIDHIDGNRLNNAWLNLREADNRQNNCNRPKQCNNTSGYKGVTYHSQNDCWVAQTWHKGKRIHISCHRTPEEAARAYKEFVLELHAEFIHPSVLLV